MKKLILSAILALVAMTNLDAQDYKWWGGGRLNLWSGDDLTTFAIAPEIGYHLSSKFTVAASIGYQSFNYDNVEMGADKDGFVLNPYLRYNVCRVGIVSCFVDGGAEFGLGDFEGVQAGLKPGLAVHLTDRFCVALHVGFLGYNDGKGIGNRTKGFGLDFSGYQSSFAFFYSF